MKKLRIKWQKFVRWLSLYWRLLGWGVLTFTLLFLLNKTTKINANYTLQELQGGTQDRVSPEYSYFLDYSPSMIGFFSVPGETMERLSYALESIHREDIQASKNYYFCDYDIQKVEDPDKFYEGMRGSETIQDRYTEIIAAGSAAEEAGELAGRLDQIDFSAVFRTGNQNLFGTGAEAVNVMITDLNFRRSGNDGEVHAQRLDAFAGALARQLAGTNLCIYSLDSAFRGNLDDEYTNALTAQGTKNESFLLIITAQNDAAFHEYLERLEAAFGNQHIGYNGKLLVGRTPQGSSQGLQIDDAVFHDAAATGRNYFNYDNLSLAKRNEYEVGLRLVHSGNSTASINMAVTALDDRILPGIPADALQESDLEAKIQVFYPSFMNALYQEAENDGFLRSSQARISMYQDKPYLCLDFSVDATEQIPSAPLGRNFCVLDVQFLLKKPVYSLPDWVLEMSAADWDSRMERQRPGFAEFVSTLLDAKSADCERLPEADRCIGSIAVYVIDQ